ncbi:hypothetical protein [Pseudomonas petrae]|uniref:Ig-like domain-containing protein n=1 Tax=Pseudomonas petrae TaxID=2912190 RepID=A0ABS9IB08_9PSED|nr:hypothetical protein [Pseudomonas petrae]MCF7530912.1 hypothetical protein [Pseudomonas petrae]MCF7536586.1 hypothetical protein [Pseudomonas petrae]MCF7544661.1 hypothetical protein [Pseudomonas petrae]MCF7554266.1 hypothetical protein [Pseudomonas petrae]
MPRVNLARPEVPAIIDPADPDGLVATGTQISGLEVLVPLWALPALPGEFDRLDLFWSGESDDRPVASESFTGPVDPTQFPFPLTVDKNLLQPDGQYQLWYTVTNDAGAVAPSDRRTVTIDTRPPSYDKQLLALLLPNDLVGGVINEAYLESHEDQVELRLPIPVYLDAQEGDAVDLYWSQNNPPTTSVVASVTVTQAQIDAEDIRIVLPGSAVRAPDRDGNFYATYKVRDRAGNETDSFSRETPATVALKPLPGGDLPEPEFPGADTYGYINCDDEPWNGIAVRISFVRNLFEYQDQITLYWQGYRTFNGSDPISGTEGVFTRTVSAQNVTDGYLDILVEPFIPHIEPILEGSALATYRLTKVSGQSGASEEGLVKINRKLPSGEICGPTTLAMLSDSRSGDGCSVCRKVRRFIARVFQAFGRGGRGK